MAPDRQNKPYTNQTEQGVLNESRDERYKVLAVEMLAENADGTALERVPADGKQYAVRIDSSAGTTLYIGKAVIASGTSAAVWQIAKLDTSSGLIKTWADGDALFNNVWDNRASLSYS